LPVCTRNIISGIFPLITQYLIPSGIPRGFSVYVRGYVQMRYVHYGASAFDRDLFSPVENLPGLCKPLGGFWLSSPEYEFSWKDWCEEWEFSDKLEIAAEFELLPTANIFRVTSYEQIKDLPRKTLTINGALWPLKFREENDEEPNAISLDFEYLARIYDGMEVLISSDERLYWALNTWDCDSLLVFNPDILIKVD